MYFHHNPMMSCDWAFIHKYQRVAHVVLELIPIFNKSVMTLFSSIWTPQNLTFYFNLSILFIQYRPQSYTCPVPSWTYRHLRLSFFSKRCTWMHVGGFHQKASCQCARQHFSKRKTVSNTRLHLMLSQNENLRRFQSKHFTHVQQTRL